MSRLEYATTLLNAPTDEIPHPVASVIQRVLLSELADEISSTKATNFLRRLATQRISANNVDVADILVDLLWVMDIENETCREDRTERMRRLTTAIIVRRNKSLFMYASTGQRSRDTFLN